MEVAIFTFNPFAENTYVLFDDTKECVIIDPGCNSREEEEELSNFIETKGLKPALLLNTHCHIDHVLGNKFIADKYQLKLTSHEGEKVVLEANTMVSGMYGIPYTVSPPIEEFLDHGDVVRFGKSELQVLFTPGHSPASISFYNQQAGVLIAGDVLFEGSIGRTDLPGGDFNTLIQSVEEQFFTLPEETQVFPGHGPSTTVGKEKASNPFFNR
jgi:hydroxyacylglutathione hydrolase